MERKIAFCVKIWSSDATLYSWTWAKQYFLRKNVDAAGVETLSPSDKLYVVHVKQQGKDRERAWNSGGPLLPGLEMALSRYPHSIVELEGGHTYSALLDFTERANIDVLILGGKEANSNFLNKLVQARPLSQQLNSKAACLIIRPASARNDKMRINSQRNLGSAMEQAAGAVGPRSSLPQTMKAKVLTAEADHDEPRQVVIAYDAVEEGRQMMSWAAKYCLAADDELHVVHYQVSQKGRKSMDEEAGGALEQEDLAPYPLKQHLTFKGDAKQEICDFCDTVSADLLVVTSTIRGRIKKALSPMGGVSSQLVLEAPCPVLVLPTQASGLHEHSASFGNSGELQGTYEVSNSPDSQGERSPPAKTPFYKIGSLRSRSQEMQLPRRQRSAALPGSITPQTSTASQGIAPHQLPSSSGVSGIAHSNSGLAQTSSGAFGGVTAGPGAGPAVGTGVGVAARPSQPSTPPQLPGPDAPKQEQREVSPLRPSVAAPNRTLSQQASISANIDLIAKLRRQLEDRDAEISNLKEEVRQLKLSQQYSPGNTASGLSSQPLLS